MIEQMLENYTIKNDDDRYNALREIMQEIALAGLYRGGFFKKAAFYGGTALRIFYNLQRYSEDLDFSLLQTDDSFTLEPYFKNIIDEFEAAGISINISKKEKSNESNIESAFLKNDTTIHVLSLKSNNISKSIKIKFEVDKRPPLGFQTEEKLLVQPFSFYVKCFTIENLYAGKVHALLFRNSKQRVKGRDWYDFEWYVRNNYELNLNHLSIRARESGNLKNEESFTKESLQALLVDKISSINLDAAKVDIKRFIEDESVLDIWSSDYFKLLTDRMKFI